MTLLRDGDLPDLGFPELDAEHRKVMGLINSLHDASTSGEDGAVLLAILDELVGFTKFHFRDEEKVMASICYPTLNQHKLQHEELLAMLATFQQSAEAGDPISNISMLEFLKNWLENHVRTEDSRLATWHRCRRGSQPAWRVP